LRRRRNKTLLDVDKEGSKMRREMDMGDGSHANDRLMD